MTECLEFLQDLLVEVPHLLVQVLDDRVHPRLLALYTDADRTHVLETSGRDQKHELHHLPILQVQQVATFDGDDYLLVDQLCFEALEMGQLNPFEICRILLLIAHIAYYVSLADVMLISGLLCLGVVVHFGIPTRVLLLLGISFRWERLLADVQLKIYLLYWHFGNSFINRHIPFFISWLILLRLQF